MMSIGTRHTLGQLAEFLARIDLDARSGSYGLQAQRFLGCFQAHFGILTVLIQSNPDALHNAIKGSYRLSDKNFGVNTTWLPSMNPLTSSGIREWGSGRVLKCS